jgi:hypothetical protein
MTVCSRSNDAHGAARSMLVVPAGSLRVEARESGAPSHGRKRSGAPARAERRPERDAAANTRSSAPERRWAARSAAASAGRLGLRTVLLACCAALGVAQPQMVASPEGILGTAPMNFDIEWSGISSPASTDWIAAYCQGTCHGRAQVRRHGAAHFSRRTRFAPTATCHRPRSQARPRPRGSRGPTCRCRRAGLRGPGL